MVVLNWNIQATTAMSQHFCPPIGDGKNIDF